MVMDSQAGTATVVAAQRCGCRHRGAGSPGSSMDRARCDGPGEFLRGQHGVDQAAGLQVLGGLYAFGERLAVQGLVDPWAQEAQQRARARPR